YQWPVKAELEHVSGPAQSLPLGRDADSPVLGDVVLDRLAARGVDTESIAWDARRFGHSPWQVVAMFSSGERIREATWEVDLSARMSTPWTTRPDGSPRPIWTAPTGRAAICRRSSPRRSTTSRPMRAPPRG